MSRSYHVYDESKERLLKSVRAKSSSDAARQVLCGTPNFMNVWVHENNGRDDGNSNGARPYCGCLQSFATKRGQQTQLPVVRSGHNNHGSRYAYAGKRKQPDHGDDEDGEEPPTDHIIRHHPPSKHHRHPATAPSPPKSPSQSPMAQYANYADYNQGHHYRQRDPSANYVNYDRHHHQRHSSNDDVDF